MLLRSIVSMSQHNPKIVAFIPARMESSRFPGKPVADLHGKPMVVRVLQRTEQSPLVDEVYVVTDSRIILDAVEKNGGHAILTSKDHPSGTDRIAEAASNIGLAFDAIVVNVQGDQPLIDPSMVEEVVRPLLKDPTIPMSTLIYRIIREQEIHDPNAVKVVADSEGYAIYFSRATIPFFREKDREAVYFKHHGIYAYRNDFLQRFVRLPQGYLEKAEHLEQLRAIEHGYRIMTVTTDKDSIEVDTPQDLERVKKTWGEID
ncbi:MAG: 3-deoxy-manno-octulosonate cytidylyltransferase [Thermodesulfobacteriota bacterium]